MYSLLDIEGIHYRLSARPCAQRFQTVIYTKNLVFFVFVVKAATEIHRLCTFQLTSYHGS